MGSKGRASKGYGSSIKYWRVPLEVQPLKTVKKCSSGDGYAQHSVSHTEEKVAQSEASASIRGLSTPQLVSAAAGIWGRVAQREDLQFNDNLKCNSSGNEIKRESTGASAGSKIVCHDLSASLFSPTLKSIFHDLKILKKQLLLDSLNKNINRLFIQSEPYEHINCSSDLTDKCESTNRNTDSDVKNESCIGAENSSPADLSAAQNTQNHDPTEALDSSTGESKMLAEDVNHPLDNLYASYLLQPLESMKETISIRENQRSGLHSDYNIEASTSVGCASSQQQEETYFCNMVSESFNKVSDAVAHNDHRSGNALCQELVLDDELLVKDWLFVQDKVKHAFANKRHALAGALSGTLVSLCLHPVDTVKTVIQSNGMGQKSYGDVLRTILAEKGVSGLYRGIASNITSSAPISAIYTYTYESVKGSLLPILPKEYHSFAHCTAGGCSSIATSFVFTPSDRIKQQMQVGSQYQNCWSALVGCLRKGGVSSLYTGWGAVLCRNIPHSIIKFYTYESLKQLFSRSARPEARLSTLQTLVCGGIAGSTAALFTTPFDVVKTRLQTQVPGSRSKYNGVLHALQEIAREEGLRSLYRGLPPRLAMYVSQGAIFFVSYEFFKTVFLVEGATSHILLLEEGKTLDPTPPRL